MKRFTLPHAATDLATSAQDPKASAVRTLLDLSARNSAALRVGHVQLAAGQRVPAEGDSQHGVEEVSLIVAGSLTGTTGGEAFAIETGDVTWIPAGEAHWAVAGPDGAEIFWVWFGDTAAEDRSVEGDTSDS